MKRDCILLCLFIWFYLAPVSSKFSWGLCPKHIPLQANFNFSDYLGNWYEIGKSKSVLYLESGSCGIDRHIKMNENSALVHWTEILGDGSIRELNQTLTCQPLSADCESKFSLLLPSFEYKIISTDYVNYSIVYSCAGFGIFNVEMLWVLGRENTIKDDIWQKIKNILTLINFNEEDLVMEDVSTCNLYENNKPIREDL